MSKYFGASYEHPTLRFQDHSGKYYRSCEHLVGEKLPFVHVYRDKSRARNSVIHFEQFQELVYGVLRGIGKGFLISKTLYQKKIVPIIVSETIKATAERMTEDWQEAKKGKKSRIKTLMDNRIRLITEGRDFFHSYLGAEILFDTSDGPNEIEEWKKIHLQTIFGITIPGKIPRFYNFQKLISDKKKSDCIRKFDYWKKKVEEGEFRVVEYPDVGDIVWYMGSVPIIEGIVVDSGKVQTMERVHGLFEMEEYGKEVVFLRKYVD